MCSPELAGGDNPLRSPEDLARHTLLHLEWSSGLSVVAGLVRLAEGRGREDGRGAPRRLVQQHGDGDARGGAGAGGGAELARHRRRRTCRRPARRALLESRRTPFGYYFLCRPEEAQTPRIKACASFWSRRRRCRRPSRGTARAGRKGRACEYSEDGRCRHRAPSSEGVAAFGPGGTLKVMTGVRWGRAWSPRSRTAASRRSERRENHRASAGNSRSPQGRARGSAIFRARHAAGPGRTRVLEPVERRAAASRPRPAIRPDEASAPKSGGRRSRRRDRGRSCRSRARLARASPPSCGPRPRPLPDEGRREGREGARAGKAYAGRAVAPGNMQGGSPADRAVTKLRRSGVALGFAKVGAFVSQAFPRGVEAILPARRRAEAAPAHRRSRRRRGRGRGDAALRHRRACPRTSPCRPRAASFIEAFEPWRRGGLDGILRVRKRPAASMSAGNRSPALPLMMSSRRGVGARAPRTPPSRALPRPTMSSHPRASPPAMQTCATPARPE